VEDIFKAMVKDIRVDCRHAKVVEVNHANHGFEWVLGKIEIHETNLRSYA